MPNFYIGRHLERLDTTTFDNWKIYMRVNNFTYTNANDFLMQFKLNNISKEKTVQEITNCYDEEAGRASKDFLETDKYQGIFPTYEIENNFARIVNIGMLFGKSDKSVKKNVESFLLFFSPNKSVTSEKSATFGESDERFEQESIEKLINRYKDKYKGIIQTDCRAKMHGGKFINAHEVLITPKFEGLIVYIERSFDKVGIDPGTYEPGLFNEIDNWLSHMISLGEGADGSVPKKLSDSEYFGYAVGLKGFLEKATNMVLREDAEKAAEEEAAAAAAAMAAKAAAEIRDKRTGKITKQGRGKKTRKKKSKRKKKNRTNRKNKNRTKRKNKIKRVKKLTRKSK